jgi:hypothetical protein
MTNETESHGVEVWLCATIYVDAESEEAAEAIVAEQAGSRESSEGLELAARDIKLYDFADGAVMSPPVSLYGLASESKLVPTDATGKVYVVEAEHFSVPGRALKLFTSRRDADIEAASMVNIMLGDQGWDQTAKPNSWSAEIEHLQEYHGAAHCYVEISERLIEGGTPDPVRDAADDILKERERIAKALDDEADCTGCDEDAVVVRDCARLVRADFSYDEAERIARIEDAAQAMLDALKEAEDRLAEVLGDDPEASMFETALEQVRAAIAKAEGGAAPTPADTVVLAIDPAKSPGVALMKNGVIVSHHWDSHTELPVEDWQTEVANGDTRQSYQEWVASKVNGAEGGAA